MSAAAQALVGSLVAAVVAPLILALILGRQRRKEKEQDYEREDKRAAAEAAARAEVAAKAEEAAVLLVESNKDVAKTAQTTSDKLDVIHTLVNSSMSAAMQAELDATVREVAMMKEVISLNRAAGREPSQEALAAVDATQTKINELRANLADRAKQQEVVEKQQQQQQQQQ